MYTISFEFEGKKQTQTFEKLSEARKNGVKYFPNVVLKNKKGVVLPL